MESPTFGIFSAVSDQNKYIADNNPDQKINYCYYMYSELWVFSAYDAAVSCPLLKLKAFTDTP